AVLVGRMEIALVGRSKGKLAAECRFFCERSARPRSAVNLARGRRAPLAAVRPRLLRTGRGDRRRSGGLERGPNGEPIALGSGRGGGVGVRLGIGGGGGGRSGGGLFLPDCGQRPPPRRARLQARSPPRRAGKRQFDHPPRR